MPDLWEAKLLVEKTSEKHLVSFLAFFMQLSCWKQGGIESILLSVYNHNASIQKAQLETTGLSRCQLFALYGTGFLKLAEVCIPAELAPFWLME